MARADNSSEFTPALGAHWLTPFYDFAIATFTRERTWRRRLVELVAPSPDDRILDVGCGTGSLAVELARLADVVGVDPDPEVLRRAARKAAKAGVGVRFVNGFFSKEALPASWRPTKIVSSLVLHQTPLDEKKRIIGAIRDILPPGGVFCLADYGRQPSQLQRFFFARMVQRIDGFENTTPNREGALERLMEDAGFDGVEPLIMVPTLTGAISLWRAVRK